MSETADDVLASLDPEQLTAARTVQGPVCILAGAGTGKTRTITHRIAYAVHAGVWRPQQVLAVTFTTRAAGEMRARLAALGVRGVSARTFHSAALRQARFFWPRVHGRDLPQILDSKIPLVAEAATRVRVALDNAGRRDVSSEIEWAKVSNVGPDAYPELATRAHREVSGVDPEAVARVFATYEEIRRDRDRIDLEDVLLCAAGLLSADESVARTVRAQYRHLTVDEYQDVSPLAQALLDLWLGTSRELCVVGDPTQTIYSFAGATPGHLIDFGRRYPEATTVRLRRDYRSTPEVVRTANALMARADVATRRTHVQLESQLPPGPAVRFREFGDEVAEAGSVAGAIRDLVRAGTDPAAIAVLYRINAQSEPLEQALADARVTYQVRGGERFFDRREVREAITLLRGAAVAEPVARVDPDESGEATEPVDVPGTVRAVLSGAGWSSTPPAGTGRTRERWESLTALADLADEAAGAGVRSLRGFVDLLAERAQAQHAPGVHGVTLSTMHAAKGLEWDHVFVVGVHEGMVPSVQSRSPEEIAEERRLLYVGITRAARGLWLSWALARNPGGASRRRPSRFLDGVRPVDSSSRDDAAAAAPTRGRSATLPRCRVCGAALTAPAERRLARCVGCPSDVDEALLDRLRTWRSDTAKALGQPAYCVFTDAALLAIAERRPSDAQQMLSVNGVGAVKLERFGPDVLRLCTERPSDATAGAS